MNIAALNISIVTVMVHTKTVVATAVTVRNFSPVTHIQITPSSDLEFERRCYEGFGSGGDSGSSKGVEGDNGSGDTKASESGGES